MRILLVEDDMLTDDNVKTGPSKMGFNVDRFTQGRRGRETLYNAPYDAVTPDLILPGADGHDILREWREEGQCRSVLILTARDALTERAEGLRSGVGDYLCRPFTLIGVITKPEALICRTNGQANNKLRHGNVTPSSGKRIATLADEPLALKPRELTLLELLIRNAGRILSRKLIEKKLHAWDGEVTNNAAEIYVHRLRRKPGSDFIHTIHGIGYTSGEK